MPRYILIDSHTGYVFGDTADFAANRQSDLTSPVDAARMLDEDMGECGCEYEELARDPHDTSTGYHVYRADIEGSEAIPVVWDGQDEATIRSVEEHCAFVSFVRRTRQGER